MKCLRVILSGLLLAVVTGCVNSRTLLVSSANSAPANYEQGIAVLKSQKTNGVVVRLLTSEFNNETYALPALFVAVANGTDRGFDFSAENITAESGGSRVKVYSYEQMQKRIKREAALMAFALAMNAAGQSIQASMPQTSYTAGTVNAYGSGGYARANYSGYTTTYNPAATANAQAQINANMMSQMSLVATSRNLQLNNSEMMLRRNTVAPGQVAGGVIKLHAPDIDAGKQLTIHITIGEEAHDFVFDVGK